MVLYSGHVDHFAFDPPKPKSFLDLQKNYTRHPTITEKDVRRAYRLAAIEHYSRQRLYGALGFGLSLVGAGTALFLGKAGPHCQTLFGLSLAGMIASAVYFDTNRNKLNKAQWLSDEEHAKYLVDTNDPGERKIYEKAVQKLEKLALKLT